MLPQKVLLTTDYKRQNYIRFSVNYYFYYITANKLAKLKIKIEDVTLLI